MSLSVNPQGDGATIVFADSGVGFTETSDSKRHGLGLMKRLIEQVGVSATLRSDHGAEWTLKAAEATMPGANFSLQSATVSQRAAGGMQRDLGDGGRMSDAGGEIRPP